MGGATALRVGHSDDRVKCTLTHDPWLTPIHKEIFESKFNKFKCPLFLLNTYKFHAGIIKYDAPRCFAKLRDENSKVEDVVIKRAGHIHQNDSIVINAFELDKEDKFPRTNCHLILQLHTWLWLSFLFRAGVYNCQEQVQIEEHIDELRAEFVVYN